MKKMIVVMMVATMSVTGLFASPTVDFCPEELAPQLCTIKISGTYDKKEININITLEAQNCAKAAGELLKAALATK
jgi:hypothetical protein